MSAGAMLGALGVIIAEATTGVAWQDAGKVELGKQSPSCCRDRRVEAFNLLTQGTASEPGFCRRRTVPGLQPSLLREPAPLD